MHPLIQRLTRDRSHKVLTVVAGVFLLGAVGMVVGVMLTPGAGEHCVRSAAQDRQLHLARRVFFWSMVIFILDVPTAFIGACLSGVTRNIRLGCVGIGLTAIVGSVIAFA